MCYTEINIVFCNSIKTGRSGELLLSDEVEDIQSLLEDLLEVEIKQTETITFLERF